MIETIVQIIGAEGWEAVWADMAEGFGFYTAPLIGWALVERGAGWTEATARKVMGLYLDDDDGVILPVNSLDYFLGYRRTGETDPKKWEARALEACREANRRTEKATNER